MTCPEVFMHSGFLHFFGRSPALGTIVVQGLGLLRMFVSLIFFLQLCLYHSVCHYFYGVRGDGYFYQSDASKLFIDFLLCVLLKSGTRGFFVLARVCSYCAGVNILSPLREVVMCDAGCTGDVVAGVSY